MIDLYGAAAYQHGQADNGFCNFVTVGPKELPAVSSALRLASMIRLRTVWTILAILSPSQEYKSQALKARNVHLLCLIVGLLVWKVTILDAYACVVCCHRLLPYLQSHFGMLWDWA